MVDISPGKQQIIDAFKGVVTTYKLGPESALLERGSIDPRFEPTGKYFHKGAECLELYCKVKTYSRVINFVERLYPGQVDVDLAYRLLIDVLFSWIAEKEGSGNRSRLEEPGLDFLQKIESAIKPILVFLPLEGLIFNSDESLALGNCELHSYHGSSSFAQALEQYARRYPRGETIQQDWNARVRSYFTFKTTAHPDRAVEQGIEEANLALSILRLFVSSYYLDEFDRRIVRRMGLLGTLHSNEKSRVFYINSSKSIEKQYPGAQMRRVLPKDYEIDPDSVALMQANGLNQVNYYIQSLRREGERNSIGRRLLKAITWFAKAASAKNTADSFLMYAISVESLLSTGRTAQRDYAIQMSALVTCDFDGCLIYPAGGDVSSSFGQHLKKASSVNERFNIVRERILKLFFYRNNIAHGAVIDGEVEIANLIDFETLAKNSILSFAKKEWGTFEDFKTWMQDSAPQKFQIT